jgi:hypothetical protein
LLFTRTTLKTPHSSPLIGCLAAPDSYLISRNRVLKAGLSYCTAGADRFGFARYSLASLLKEEIRSACAECFGLPSEVVVCHSSSFVVCRYFGLRLLLTITSLVLVPRARFGFAFMIFDRGCD